MEIINFTKEVYQALKTNWNDDYQVIDYDLFIEQIESEMGDARNAVKELLTMGNDQSAKEQNKLIRHARNNGILEYGVSSHSVAIALDEMGV